MAEENHPFPVSEVTYSAVDPATGTVSVTLPTGYRFKPAEPVCDEKGNVVDYRYMGIERIDSADKE
jgi:hypothetical protein